MSEEQAPYHRKQVVQDVPLDEVYLYLLSRTQQQYRKLSQALFDSNGVDLTSDQWIVLKRIAEKEGLMQKEIAGLVSKDPGSVTRIIDLLEKKGFVSRDAVLTDRRQFALSLTASGAALVKKVTPLARKLRKQGLDGFSKTEEVKLNEMLNRLYKNFNR
jgi:DNA-binding MarR family transcriptional regulator